MARIDTLKNFLTDIADKFREKLGTTEEIIHAEYDTKIDEVYNIGKTVEYERFWSYFLNEGQREDFNYALCGDGWNDHTLNIPSIFLPLKPTTSQYIFRYCGATVIPSIDFTNCATLNNTYAYARNAVTIGVVILKPDGTNIFTNAFNYCDDLVHISFEGVIGTSISFSRSSKLSSESIDNIIDHLKDLTGATTQTITFHSSSGTILNEAYKDEGVTKREKITSLGWDVVC